uniref:Uncharacterized protein n=1 Tax=Setaria viridis TaxID=4556 RepID=A0A4U6UTZ4_SETVI|nr:hypothetical protein SEVIR_4G057601v2 [Setaria viridis]
MPAWCAHWAVLLEACSPGLVAPSAWAASNPPSWAGLLCSLLLGWLPTAACCAWRTCGSRARARAQRKVAACFARRPAARDREKRNNR